MNHYVPDFEMDDDYTIHTSSNLIRSKKSPMAEEEVMELLWENGQVVMQSQDQRSSKKSSLLPPKYDDVAMPAAAEIRPPPPPDQAHQHQHKHQHLFMQEDEMASWLHFDQDFCPADLFYPSSNAATAANSSTTTSITNIVSSTAPLVRSIVQNHTDLRPHAAVPSSSRPPIPPARRPEAVANFAHFSRHKARGGLNESGPSNLRESTMVDSSDTPAAAARRSADDARGNAVIGVPAMGTSLAAASAAGGRNRESTACEMTMTSSTGGSYATTEPSPSQKPAAEDRKRKGREEDVECYSEDAEFESVEVKKKVRGSTSTKRSRAAEVHNLSERRRRDRINEKMKALQELIPRCNKSDKASMLDEAIEYLKSLQMQVQMMSMGCGMVPMMFPGVQQYMPPMGMAMGMGIGMEMGMNRPMMPFPNVLAGAPLPTPTAAAHLGPRFPVPAFHMPHVPSHDSSQIAASQSDPMLSSLVSQNPNQPQVPSYTDPYQQFINLQQMQMMMPQSQAMTSKPSTSQGTEHIDNHQSGT